MASSDIQPAKPDDLPDDDPRDARPALRNLEVHQASQDGRSGVALSDPLGIAQGQIFVPDGLLPVVGRFDGKKTIAEIEAELVTNPGEELPDDLVTGLARQLDEMMWLDGPRFRRALQDVTAKFATLASRPSPHAGVTAGYPDDPGALREALDSIVRRPSGTRRATPRGLVAPHIDIARGREGYSMGYGALAECEPADLYVVFGTGHQGPGAPVTGLAMDWETPLGIVATDREFVNAIHGRLGPPHPSDLLLHRQEHSLEFQMLFLRHLLGDRQFQVAGFLTGQLLNTASSVDDEPLVQSLLGVFREQCDRVRESGRSVCFIGGADLAHIGPFFGDTDPIDEARLERLTSQELPKLQHLEAGDPGAFFAAVESDGNRDRICGTTPMFLTAALAGGPGRLLHYGQANATDGNQTVSYCSILFEADPDGP
jgi:MEMO1 family protein